MGEAAALLSRPFAEAAFDLNERGLAVLPCPADDGKSPRGAVSGFDRWRMRPGARFLERLVDRWGDANIGVLTSLSGVTVADVDGDEAVAREIIRRAGDTPLVTRTPSGGLHLWYRSRGEHNANLRPIGLPVDVKGSASGIVIVPPSFRPSTQVAYTFERGTWDDLARLPFARPDSLSIVDCPASARIDDLRPGNRNNALFRRALREARHCDDLESLVDVLNSLNEQTEQPMYHPEVENIAKSAWGYETRGQNWVGQEARAVIGSGDLKQFSTCSNSSDALFLFVTLRTAHGARDRRGEPFAISPRAMADKKVVGKWSASRIRNARQTLVKLNYLEPVHRGGRGPGDPSLFRFSN